MKTQSTVFNPVLPDGFKYQNTADCSCGDTSASWGHRANLRGQHSERAVAEALEKIRRHPELLVIPIESVIHASPNSELDASQVDFLINLRGGLDVKLQVKSAELKRKKFIRKMRKFGKFIICVAVTAWDDSDRVFQKVVTALRKAISKIKHLEILEQLRQELEDSKGRRRLRYNNQPHCRMCH